MVSFGCKKPLPKDPVPFVRGCDRRVYLIGDVRATLLET